MLQAILLVIKYTVLELGYTTTKKGLAITPILMAWQLAVLAKSFFTYSIMYL
jgi:hypothetical protein